MEKLAQVGGERRRGSANLRVLARLRRKLVLSLHLLCVLMEAFRQGKLQAEPVIHGTKGRNLLRRA